MGQVRDALSAAAGAEEIVAAGAPASFVELTGGSNPFGSIYEAGKHPALLDVDGDGDLDLLLGNYDTGPLRYFRNDAGSYVEQTGVANPFNPFAFASGFSSPTPIDLDGDGDLDFVVGAQTGSLRAFRNDGPGNWTNLSVLGGIDVGDYSAPVAIDIDGDGRQDIVTGNFDGTFNLFHNNGDGSFTELTGAANPFAGIDVGVSSAIGFLDVDGDGDLDAVVSNRDDLVAVYADEGNHTFVLSATNPFGGFGLADEARFAFTDLDADGDLDAVVGFWLPAEPIRVFQQAGAPAGIRGTNGNNTLNGTAGADTIDGRGGADVMAGGLGSDSYYVDSALDQAIEGAGQGTADRIFASVSYTLGAGVQVEFLSTNNETEHGAIDLIGNELANRIIGNAGANVLDGGAGNDALSGGAGNDTMIGGAGDDVFYVREAGDVVIEAAGAGTDVVRAGVDYTLTDNVENLFIGSAARDGTGNTLANALHGSGSSNTLSGLGGDDVIRGGGGRDTVLGGGGADLLDGGAGKDTLTGGAARDVFQFRDGDMGATRALADVITDFRHADAEKIQLSLVDANTAAAGDQAFAFIGSGAFTGVAGQLHYAQSGGNTYVEGDTNGDGVADFAIRLNGLVNLVAADFVL